MLILVAAHKTGQHTHHFYCATLCVSTVFAVVWCLSVRLSCWWIASSRLKISSNFLFNPLATSLYFLSPNADTHFQGETLQWGCCPPSSIWYNVIADHPELVFNGPNILPKLHVDRHYTLQDIVIFIFSWFGLKLPINALYWNVFGGYYSQMNSDIVATIKRTVLG